MSQAVARPLATTLRLHEEPALRLTRAHARPEPLPGSRWSTSSLTERLRALCAGRTPQGLARLTGASADAVRRYLRGAAAPPGFLARLADCMDVSPNWLLTGRGPIRRAELTALALERASASELLVELARRVSRSGDQNPVM